jgi:hypothetical protein
MSRKTGTIIGGCCAVMLLVVGGIVALGVFGIKKAVSGYQEIQTKADAQAAAFLTAVGKGKDGVAYQMLSAPAKTGESQSFFGARMKELRSKTGDFGPPFPASGVNFHFNNDDRVLTRSYAINGAKSTATMTITLHQLGSNPWEIQNTFAQ